MSDFERGFCEELEKIAQTGAFTADISDEEYYRALEEMVERQKAEREAQSADRRRRALLGATIGAPVGMLAGGALGHYISGPRTAVPTAIAGGLGGAGIGAGLGALTAKS